MELLVHLLPVLWRGCDVPREALLETEVSCGPTWACSQGNGMPQTFVLGLNLLGLQGQPFPHLWPLGKEGSCCLWAVVGKGGRGSTLQQSWDESDWVCGTGETRGSAAA